MIGAIIGDIAGSRFEYCNHKSKVFEIFDERCFLTDDSYMTIAVGKAIKECNGEYGDEHGDKLRKAVIGTMREFGRRYPDCGFGGGFKRWLRDKYPMPYLSYGNGAAMRVSGAGFYAISLEEAKKLAYAVTAVTHNHEEGLKGAEATAVCIYLAKTGAGKDEIRKYVQENYYPLEFTIDEIRPTYYYDVTTQGTVPQAIEAFLESKSFEDCLRTAVSVGGDCDTLTAIACSIAEAFYGVPEDMKERAMEYMDEYTRDEFAKVEKSR